MHNSYRILISVLAIVFSLAAACIGFALVGNLSIFFSAGWLLFYFYYAIYSTSLVCNFFRANQKRII